MPTPPSTAPGPAFEIIQKKLESIFVFARSPALAQPQLFVAAGNLLAQEAANLVAEISRRKIDNDTRRQLGAHALGIAQMADACMAHANALAAAVAAMPKGGG